MRDTNTYNELKLRVELRSVLSWLYGGAAWVSKCDFVSFQQDLLVVGIASHLMRANIPS